MSNILTVIAEKGGVGKSQIAMSVGVELANRGKKVLLIDMDGQNANLTYFLGVEKEEDMLTVSRVCNSSKKNLHDAILEIKDNLYLVPSDQSMIKLDNTTKLSSFKKEIESVKNEYDYILIDVCPTPGWSHYLSLSVSDYAILVMLPDIASIESNNGVFDSVEEIQATNNGNLKVMGILFNKYENRTTLSKQVVEIASNMAKEHDTKVFNTRVRDLVAMRENVYMNQGITDYAPTSESANDIRTLVDEIESEV